jgi:hypothetical protein
VTTAPSLRRLAAVRSNPVGAGNQPLIDWINQPTFQQVVEVERAAPR